MTKNRFRPDAALATTAGVVVATALALVAAFQVYWAFGGTWGLGEALGRTVEESSVGVRVASAVVALALVAATVVVLGRVALVRTVVPFAVFRWGAWALTGVLVLVALMNAVADTTWERFVFAPLALALAALSTVVSLAPADRAPRDRAAGPRVQARREPT